MLSTSTSTSSTSGIYSSVYTYPNSTAYNYGLYNRIYTQGTGNSYGLYTKNQIQSTYSGSNHIFGIYADIDGGDNHTGNTYGLRLINDGTTTGTEYGVYSTGEDINYFSGKVGVGTTNPARLLELQGNDGYVGISLNNTGANGNSWDILSMSDGGNGSVSDGGLTFWNGTHRMVLDASGNLGIGTADPQSNLHINGSSTLGKLMITPDESSSEDDSEIFLGEDDDGTYGMNIKYDGGDNKLYIGGKMSSTTYGPHLSIKRDDGKVGIGTDNPGYQLDVNGDARIGWHGDADRIYITPFDVRPYHGYNYSYSSGNQVNEFLNNGGSVYYKLYDGIIQIYIPTGYKATECRLYFEKYHRRGIYL